MEKKKGRNEAAERFCNSTLKEDGWEPKSVLLLLTNYSTL